jgi:hypothetical protein
MKHLIRLGIVAGFTLLGGCIPSVNSNLDTISNSVTNSLTGSDKYEIQWSGTSGKQLYAGYSIASTDGSAPMRVESVQAKLPHKVSFSAPKNAIVSASGVILNQEENVEIKIYKNGSECGKVAIVGSGAAANKVCQ